MQKKFIWRWIQNIKNSISKSEFGSEAYQHILIINRNKDWVMKLAPVMQKESFFIAVGAGYLPGKKGLINLSKERDIN